MATDYSTFGLAFMDHFEKNNSKTISAMLFSKFGCNRNENSTNSFWATGRLQESIRCLHPKVKIEQHICKLVRQPRFPLPDFWDLYSGT
jgi:hypothetical protein